MSTGPTSPPSALLQRLRDDRPLVAVELRPPKTGLSDSQSMDTWIDMYHSVRRLARGDTAIFLTDNAVGVSEEENLRHLVANLAGDVSPAKLSPFLTCKHTIEYCRMYVDRAVAAGFEALTVLGGDRTVGPPRCVEFAYMLRQQIRERHPDLALGGWANPHRDAAEQVGYLMRPEFTGEFYLTQIVSHHSLREVERFVNETRKRGLEHPGVFGVFLYRSDNPATLERLGEFFPVPAEGVVRDFESGRSAEEICAHTIGALREVGVEKIYLSNLGFRKPEERFKRVLQALD
jgi:hypothetical protein